MGRVRPRRGKVKKSRDPEQSGSTRPRVDRTTKREERNNRIRTMDMVRVRALSSMQEIMAIRPALPRTMCVLQARRTYQHAERMVEASFPKFRLVMRRRSYRTTIFVLRGTELTTRGYWMPARMVPKTKLARAATMSWSLATALREFRGERRLLANSPPSSEFRPKRNP